MERRRGGRNKGRNRIVYTGCSRGNIDFPCLHLLLLTCSHCKSGYRGNSIALCDCSKPFSLFLPPCLSLSWDISTSDRYTRRSARGSPTMPEPGQSSVRPGHFPTSSRLCMDLLSPQQRKAMERFSPTQTIYQFSISW